jgi:hypothetical protein
MCSSIVDGQIPGIVHLWNQKLPMPLQLAIQDELGPDTQNEFSFIQILKPNFLRNRCEDGVMSVRGTFSATDFRKDLSFKLKAGDLLLRFRATSDHVTQLGISQDISLQLRTILPEYCDSTDGGQVLSDPTTILTSEVCLVVVITMFREQEAASLSSARALQQSQLQVLRMDKFSLKRNKSHKSHLTFHSHYQQYVFHVHAVFLCVRTVQIASFMNEYDCSHPCVNSILTYECS